MGLHRYHTKGAPSPLPRPLRIGPQNAPKFFKKKRTWYQARRHVCDKQGTFEKPRRRGLSCSKKSEGREWGVRSVVVDFGVFGVPRFSVQRPPNPLNNYFGTSRLKIGAPQKRENQPRGIQPPHSRPSEERVDLCACSFARHLRSICPLKLRFWSPFTGVSQGPEAQAGKCRKESAFEVIFWGAWLGVPQRVLKGQSTLKALFGALNSRV